MKSILKVLNGESLTTPSAWLMRQAGRYLPEYRELRAKTGGFFDLVYNPALAAEVTLQPIYRFGMDAAILFSDILVVPQAMGQLVTMDEGRGPRLGPLTDLETLHSNIGLFDTVAETVDRVKSQLDDKTTLIGFCGAPWTVAAYMLEGGGSRDFNTAKTRAYNEPALMSGLLDKIVDASAAYLIKQIQAGAEALQIFDSWAGVLSEQQFRDWVIAPTRKLIAKVKAAYSDIPVIGFPRGGALMIGDYVQQTGVDAVQLDTTFPTAMAQAIATDGVPVQGWLDPVLLLNGGATLQKEVETMKQAMQGLPYIFNLGHGVIKETPPEHVAQLLKALRS